MQNRKRDTDLQNSHLDSVGEGEGGCFKRTASKHVYYMQVLNEFSWNSIRKI